MALENATRTLNASPTQIAHRTQIAQCIQGFLDHVFLPPRVTTPDESNGVSTILRQINRGTPHIIVHPAELDFYRDDAVNEIQRIAIQEASSGISLLKLRQVVES